MELCFIVMTSMTLLDFASMQNIYLKYYVSNTGHQKILFNQRGRENSFV